MTANQTLIVALGASFDGSDTTQPTTHAGISADHAGPSTACYSCHKTLDPMRMFFRQAFTLGYSEQRAPALLAESGELAFAQFSKVGIGLPALGAALAEHPRFAEAWTDKLCYYANSSACLGTDPEFVRVVSVFRARAGSDHSHPLRWRQPRR